MYGGATPAETDRVPLIPVRGFERIRQNSERIRAFFARADRVVFPQAAQEGTGPGRKFRRHCDMDRIQMAKSNMEKFFGRGAAPLEKTDTEFAAIRDRLI